MSRSSVYVHPSAVIDEPVSLGEGVKIWHFCHVMTGASIGARSSLGQNVFVAANVSIGSDVKIQNNVSIYDGVILDDEVFCGPSCVFTNVGHPRAALRHEGPYEKTLVRRGATLGANSTIVCGSLLGRHCFIAAGAVVARGVVPDYALMVGVPARRVGWMGRHGERLSAPDHDGVMRCPKSGWRYVEQALEVVRCLDWDEDRPLALAASFTETPSIDIWIPMLDLKAQYASMRPEIDAAVARVFASQVFIGGPEVDALEREMSETLKRTVTSPPAHARHPLSRPSFGEGGAGASEGSAQTFCIPSPDEGLERGTRGEVSSSLFALGVSSGTDALLLALMSVDVGPGDEVITSPYSFVATAEVIARLGAKAVFVDVDPSSFLIDVDRIEQAISPRTKAIVPVHLFGQMVPMAQLVEIAKRHGLAVIEDAAQAIGARLDGRAAGSWGDVGCFSFFPSKNLGAAGDAGLVVTSNGVLASRIRALRNHGMQQKYLANEIGGNHRLDALQAAVLRAKLPYLDRWTSLRRQNALAYLDAFRTLIANEKIAPSLLSLPHQSDGHVWHQLVIRSSRRDELRAHLDRAKIASEIYYPHPLHLLPAFAGWGYRPGDYPEAERASRETLALPMYPELGEARRQRVIDAVVQFVRASRSE